MIKANSLLYSIYICLIVAVLCSGMLYMSGLYTQLNNYYMSRQDLYMYNESLVNFALSHMDEPGAVPDTDDSGVQSFYKVKHHGIIPVVTAGTVMGNDTVLSCHMVGCGYKDKTALYVPDKGIKSAYSGVVHFFGNIYVPDAYLNTAIVVKEPAKLTKDGLMDKSGYMLPKPLDVIVNGAAGSTGVHKELANILKGDSIRNSFSNEPIEINARGRLSGITITGNVIITSADSLAVSSTAHLEDVIIIAPKVSFEKGFKGSVQVFANRSITVGSGARLEYPSVLYINSADAFARTSLVVKEKAEVYGAIVVCGNDYSRVDYNNVYIEENVKAVCDIYCAGNISLKSDIAGSVYANKVSYKTTVIHNNVIANVAVGPLNRAKYFFSVPMMYKGSYEAIKKVM